MILKDFELSILINQIHNGQIPLYTARNIIDEILPSVMTGIIGEYINITQPEVTNESLYVLDLKELKTFNNKYINYNSGYGKSENKKLKTDIINAIIDRYSKLSNEAKSELLMYIERHADDEVTLGDFKNVYREINKKLDNLLTKTNRKYDYLASNWSIWDTKGPFSFMDYDNNRKVLPQNRMYLYEVRDGVTTVFKRSPKEYRKLRSKFQVLSNYDLTRYLTEEMVMDMLVLANPANDRSEVNRLYFKHKIPVTTYLDTSLGIKRIFGSS